MKRILLSLAAVAVLASCVKENNLASLAGQETISAVSSDSKTLLDGNAVVWETTDKIAVVVNGETQVKTAEFAVVEETVNGSEADFVGNTGADWSKATFAYAVYPAASVNLTHNLPAEQNGEVSGLMLSTAVVPVADMKNGSASVEFNPALSLLNVMVPAGVKSVELTSAGSALVGEATFEVGAEAEVELTVAEAGKTVTLTVAEAGTYPVIVYPGTVGDFTIKLVGTNDETFEKTVPDITLVAAEARAVNLMQIFEFAPEAMEVAANGGTIELPFTTTVEEITVTEDADWLESAVAVKGFQTGNVTLVADANEGEETRTAVVTVSWGEGKSVSFTLTQPAIYRGFLNDADGNPIQWEETFKVYASETDANAEANVKATYKNVFTIALNDEDYTKGTYKISNMFKTDGYFNEGYHTNKGGEYYADYADGKLTVKMAGAIKSYFFTKDIVLTYDETAQKFTSNGVLSFDMNAYSSYNKAGVVAGYAAAVKVEDAPEVGGDLTVAGEWNQAGTVGGAAAYATVTITLDGDQVTLTNFLYEGTVVTGTLVGNTITIPANTMISNSTGPLSADLVLTVSDNLAVITAPDFSIGGWVNVTGYTATREVPSTPEVPVGPSVNIAGTWNQTVVGMSWPTPSATMTITVDGSTVTLTDFVAAGTVVTATFENNQIVVPKGTAIGAGLNQAGPLDADVVLTLEGNTFTAAPFVIGGYMNITSYSATNPDMEVGGGEEPEVPADPWASDAVVTYDLPAGASDSRQVLRQIKYVADAKNLYIKLQASATLFTEKNVAYLGLVLLDTTAGTAGSGYWGWWNGAKGDLEFNKEHAGTFNGTDLVLNVGDVQIEAAAETSDDLHVWTFAIPRSAHEVLALDKVYMGVLVMEAFEPCGAMPDKYGNMLEVTLP